MTNGNGKVKVSIQEAIEIGISAVKRGEVANGRRALQWVLEKDPNNTTAWLWLACCLEDDKAKDECYRRVSSITGVN